MSYPTVEAFFKEMGTQHRASGAWPILVNPFGTDYDTVAWFCTSEKEQLDLLKEGDRIKFFYEYKIRGHGVIVTEPAREYWRCWFEFDEDTEDE